MYPLTLFALLMVLAGVIAYAGDVLGTTVGRRRLSLFGWRPKRTGRVVGIVAGVLIMLSTMGILSLAFRDATGVILRSQRVAEELDALRGQRRALEQQVTTTQAELSQAQTTIISAEAARDAAREARSAALRIRARLLEDQVALRVGLAGLEVRVDTLSAEQVRLQEENAELALSNETLVAGNAELSEQNAAYQSRFNNLQNQLVTLQTRLQDLRLTSNREAQNLRETLSLFEATSGRELSYRKGEIVHSGLVAAQNEEAILTALERFVSGAQEAVFARGASGVELRTDQLRGLSGALAASPGEDLVVLVAADNFVGTPIEVNVEAFPNSKLLQKGQLIASRPIHAGGPGVPVSRAALRTEVVRLAQASLNRLQRGGLFEQVRPTPSEADFEAFTASLARLSGPVMIGAVAREDVYVAGPAALEFVILY